MNKMCYRVIFSRSQGELRVVSELARSCGAMPGQPCGTGTSRLWVTLRALMWRISLALFAGPVLADGIVADTQLAPEMRPEVISVPDRPTLVNINPPNSAGVSHNQYQQFDVNSHGAILNNSAGGSFTQLAGDIPGNSRFDQNTAPASIIINEVNSSNPSQLRGYLEVAGDRAQVIIANPSGIICDGCGTINAGRLTLTTGKPQLNPDGTVAGYHVERGLIRVEGSGLNRNARYDTDYVDIMARAVKVNAEIWATKGISVVAGRNQLSAEGKIISTLPAKKDQPAEMAIDMGHLGGMYSGHIQMIGTEVGIGVRNQGGRLHAKQTLTVTSEGKLLLQSDVSEPTTIADGPITLIAKDSVEHHGKLYSGGELTLESRQGKIKQSGTLGAKGSVTLRAEKAINSTGRLLAGSEANDTLTHKADLTLTSQTEVNASGSLMSRKTIDINGKHINLKQSRLTADQVKFTATQGDVVLKLAHVTSKHLMVDSVGDVDTRQARIRAGSWQILAENLSNQKGVWSQMGQEPSKISLWGTFDNTNGIFLAYDVGLYATSFNNLRGRIFALTDKPQYLHMGDLRSNQEGVIGANGKLHINVNTMNNQQGTVLGFSDLFINANGDIKNHKGKLKTNKNFTLLSQGNIDNQSGTVAAKNNFSWKGGSNSNFDNSAGSTLSEGKLTLIGGDVFNRDGGYIESRQAFKLDLKKEWNNQGGSLICGGSGSLCAQDLNNAEGSIQGMDTLNMKIENTLDNSNGSIVSQRSLHVCAKEILNALGTLNATKALEIVSGQINNNRGVISSPETMDIVTKQLSNRDGGSLNSAADITLSAEVFDNTGGMLESVNSVLVVKKKLDNQQGKIKTQQTLEISGDNRGKSTPFIPGDYFKLLGELDNTKGIIESQNLKLDASSFNNTSGRLVALGKAPQQWFLGNLTSNQKGLIGAKGSLQLDVRTMDNQHGKVESLSHLVINAVGDLKNHKGKLQTGADLTLNCPGNVDNRAGVLQAKQGLTWAGSTHSQFDNNAGRVSSEGELSLFGGGVSNRERGIVQSGRDFSVNLAEGWDNRYGNLRLGGRGVMRARALYNEKGNIKTVNTLDMEFKNRLDNGKGNIVSQGAINAKSGNLLDTHGNFSANQSIKIKSGQINNNRGVISSQETLDIVTKQLNNRDGGSLNSGADITLSAEVFDNTGGMLESVNSVLVVKKKLDNQQGNIKTQQTLEISGDKRGESTPFIPGGYHKSLGELDNTKGIIESQNLKLDTSSFNNTSGRLIALGKAPQQWFLGNLTSNQKGLIGAKGSLQLDVRSMDNQQGNVESLSHLVINAIGDINNYKGTLQTDADLTLNCQGNVDNRAGVLQAKQGLTWAGSTHSQFDNNAGRVSSESELSLFGGGVSNRERGIVQSGRDFSVNLAEGWDNRYGNLRLGGRGVMHARALYNENGNIKTVNTLDMEFINRLDNGKGNIASQGAINAKSDNILNKQGNIGANLAIKMLSTQIDNNQGLITSQDMLDIHTKQLNNSYSGALSSEADITLTADVLDNCGGRLESVNSVLVVKEKLDNRQGSISTRQSLKITGDNNVTPLLNNSNGNIQSGGTLEVSAGLLENQNGTLQSHQGFTLNTQHDLTQNDGDTLSSNTVLTLNIPGKLTNAAQWLLPGELIVNSAHFTNQGKLVANKLLFNNIGVFNLGRIETSTLDFSINKMVNHAFIIGENVNIRSQVVENKGSEARIAATQRLNVHASERVSNLEGGLIYSGGGLHLASDNLIENRASHIHAAGDMLLEARHLDNTRVGLAIEYGAEKNDYWWHRHNLYWRSYGSGVNNDVNTMARTTRRFTFRDEHAAMHDHYGTLQNIDTANKRAEMRVFDRNIHHRLLNININYLALTPIHDGSYDMTFYEMRGYRQGASHARWQSQLELKLARWTPFHNTFWREHDQGYMTVWDPERHIDIGVAPHVSDYNNLRERTVTGKATRDKLINAGEGASILSGGNLDLRINGQIINDASIISANGNLTTGAGAKIANRGYSVNERREEHIVDHYDRDTRHWYPTSHHDQTTALTTIDAIINGGGNVTLKGVHLDNITVNPAQINPFAATLNPVAQDNTHWSPSVPSLTSAPDHWVINKALMPKLESSLGADSLALMVTHTLPEIETHTPESFDHALMVNHFLPGVPAHLPTLSENALMPAQGAASRTDILPQASWAVSACGDKQAACVAKKPISTSALSGHGAMISGGNLQLSMESINNLGNLYADSALNVDSRLFINTGGILQAGAIRLHADRINLNTNLQDALRQASMSARNIDISGNDISLQGAKLNALENLRLSAGNSLGITTARRAVTADVKVIAGNLGNRYGDAPGLNMLTGATGNPYGDGMGQLMLPGSVGDGSSNALALAGTRMARVQGEWQQALGSSLSAGNNLILEAVDNVTLQGGKVTAGNKLGVQAGGNVSLLADTTVNNTLLQANSRTSAVVNQRREETLHTSELSGNNGIMILSGKNFIAQGAIVDSVSGGIALGARQVTIKEARQRLTESDGERKAQGNHKSQRLIQHERDISFGSVFHDRQGTLAIAGQGDLILQGSEMHSEIGKIELKALGDILIHASRDTQDYKEQGSSSSKRVMGSSRSKHRIEEHASISNSSLLSGQEVILHSGKDISMLGSNVAADQNISLKAGNNIAVGAAENHYHYSAASQSTSSGLSGRGMGLRYGNNSMKSADTKDILSHAGSIVGSNHGDISFNAGNTLMVQGSDVLAGKNINLTGKDIKVLPIANQTTQTHKLEQHWRGLTLGASGAVGSAVSSAITHIEETREESDGRLAALKGMKAALSGLQVAQSGVLAAIKTDDKNAIGASLSYGSQSHKSEQSISQTQSQGSQVTASSDLYIQATERDVTVQGSRLQAGKNITINAERDIHLLSALNTQSVKGKNESKGGSIGVGVAAGQGGWGINVSAGVNKGGGHEAGNTLTHTVTTVNAGDEISVSALRDTTLTGAQLSGEKVALSVGRNLALTSEQDHDNYDAKQQNVSAGGSYSFGSMSGSANVNASRDKMHSRFASVREQTGVFAGKSGFAISVGEHTQLTGAVIGSTAAAHDNTLTTGTLGFSHIENTADFEVEHQSVSISSDGGVGAQLMGNMAIGLLAGGNNSGSAQSTTQSAVSEGALTLRNPEHQQQDVAYLSRDVEHAHQALSPIFNKEQEQQRLKEARLISEIGAQVMSIAHTQGQIIATQAANDKMLNVRPEDLSAAETKLKADNPGKQPTAEDIKIQVYKTAYNEAFAESGFGTGGRYQMAMQAATAAVQGLAGGNMAQALAGAGAPYVAQVIHHMTTDPLTDKVNTTANLMAHATLGAVVAQANGNNALAGAAGGAIGEYIAQQLYPGADRNQLSEDKKQTISVLSTLAAGLAGGLAGGDSASAVAGAQAGKNAVENNFLSPESMPKGLADLGSSVTSYAKYARENNLPPEQVQADLTRMVKGDLPEGADIVKAILSNTPVSDTVMAVLTAQEAKDYALALLSTLPAERALAAVGKAANVITTKHIIRAAEKVTTAKPGKQFTQPRDLNEQVLWNQVKESPADGKKFSEMGFNLNSDPRFPQSSGFEKMTASHKLPNGSNIEIHYQHNSVTGKAYDMKIVTPQRTTSNPSDVIESIKDNIR